MEKKVEVPVHMRPRKPLSDDTGLLPFLSKRVLVYTC